MSPDKLYRRCDEALLPFLGPKGFDRANPGEYVRKLEGGRDRILVSHGPRAKKFTHFAVFMSYYPDALEPLFELVDFGDEDRGFLCGPYLNPVSVTPRPKYWGYRTAEALERSLKHVLECLENAGLPWLETLRDPKVFAASADPVAALPTGLANEVAGNFEKARESYREMYRRVHLILKDSRSEKDFVPKFGKTYVFVTAKLGIDTERREAVEEKLGYHPDIKPLPE